MSPVSLNILFGAASGALCAGIMGYVLTLPILKFLPSLSGKFAGRMKPFPPLTLAQKILAVGSILGLFLMALDDFLTGLSFIMVAILCAYGIEKGPGFMKNRRLGKRKSQLGEVFPQALGMSIQALKTGQTVPQVLDYLSREAPAPLREELSLVCAEIEHGFLGRTVPF